MTVKEPVWIISIHTGSLYVLYSDFTDPVKWLVAAGEMLFELHVSIGDTMLQKAESNSL